MKKEKWRAAASFGEKNRLVVDQDNVLIADCYSNSAEDYGLPSLKEYENNARRIAMLPVLVELLEEAEYNLPFSSLIRNRVEDMLERYNKLRPKE